ncbi:MAG: DUF3817 domain-containing protein [Acidimicrobiales bacterium]
MAESQNARSLRRYRVLAYTTAVLLIVLCFVGIPLQVWDHNLWVVRIVGTAHGYLYLVYLVVAFDLSRRMGIRLPYMVLVLLAGTIPFCAIVSERLLTRRYEHLEELAVEVGHEGL